MRRRKWAKKFEVSFQGTDTQNEVKKIIQPTSIANTVNGSCKTTAN